MKDIHQLKVAISNLESQRDVLGDEVVNAAIGPLKLRLAELEEEKRTTSVIPEGERKLVTIMFADISGFTAMSESMDPEEVHELMNKCFEHLVPVVGKYGGTVDKFIGDEIMVLFGAPVAHEDDPVRALKAALEMKQALVKFNETHHCDLGIHMGINTGKVIAGGIGSKELKQYSVMGDAVNLAARLEDASERDEVFVGPETYRLTSAKFQFEALEPVKMKGKTDPVHVYSLTGTKELSGDKGHPHDLASPLVGRDKERDILRNAIIKLQNGRGGIMTVIGEAGLGKSRLVAEIRGEYSKMVAWFEGKSFSYTKETSFLPVRGMIYDLLGVPTNMAATEVGKALHAELKKYFPGKDHEMYPYLARLLHIPLEEIIDEQLKYLTPEALQGRIIKAVFNLLKARASKHPLVIVWEDLHWADSSTFTLLEALAHITGEVPLLLIFVFRPVKEEQEWNFHQRLLDTYGENYSVIKLAPLSIESSEELVFNILDIKNLPDKIQRIIFEKAEGNPFFLEEIIHSMIDAGNLTVKDNVAIAFSDIIEFNIPNTVQEIISARIDRLPPDNKKILQTASVIGRIFWYQVLQSILNNRFDEIKLVNSLNELNIREFIRVYITKDRNGKTPVADLEYIFKHVIIQEVAYNGLLFAQRKALHREVAETIKKMFPGIPDEYEATLALHYQRAEMHEEAIIHLKRAADHAKAIYANSEAIIFYKEAVNQVSKILQRGDDKKLEWNLTAAHLLENLGDVLVLTGKYEEARQVFEESIEKTSIKDNNRIANLYRKIGKVWDSQKNYREAAKYFDIAESKLQSGRGKKDKAWWQGWIVIQCDRMELYYWQNDLQIMVELAEKTRPLVDQYATPEQRAHYFTGLALMTFRRDRYLLTKESSDYALAAVAASSKSDNFHLLTWSKFLLGFSYLWEERYDEAENVLLETLALTERSGDIMLQARCLTYLTTVYRRKKQVHKVKDYLSQCFEKSASANMAEYIAAAYANQSWVNFMEGDFGESEKNATLAMETWESVLAGHATRSVVQWMVCCQLVEINADKKDLQKAAYYAAVVLDPKQKRLQPDLSAAYQSGIDNWEKGSHEDSVRAFTKAGTLARKYGYL